MNEIKEFLTSYCGYMVIGLITSIVSYAKKVREGHLKFSWLDAFVEEEESMKHLSKRTLKAIARNNSVYLNNCPIQTSK